MVEESHYLYRFTVYLNSGKVIRLLALLSAEEVFSLQQLLDNSKDVVRYTYCY